jgi:hypothetical protein
VTSTASPAFLARRRAERASRRCELTRPPRYARCARMSSSSTRRGDSIGSALPRSRWSAAKPTRFSSCASTSISNECKRRVNAAPRSQIILKPIRRKVGSSEWRSASLMGMDRSVPESSFQQRQVKHLDALGVHRPAFAPQYHGQASIAKPQPDSSVSSRLAPGIGNLLVAPRGVGPQQSSVSKVRPLSQRSLRHQPFP